MFFFFFSDETIRNFFLKVFRSKTLEEKKKRKRLDLSDASKRRRTPHALRRRPLGVHGQVRFTSFAEYGARMRAPKERIRVGDSSIFSIDSLADHGAALLFSSHP